MSAALNLSPGNVDLALQIVNFDDAVAPAVKYVFGSSLICKGNEFNTFFS